jgi:predicted secreted protein
MSVPFALAIYFVLWWVVLFAVLPWGVRSQDESGEVAPGTEPGAPVRHRLALKFLWTTIVSAALLVLFYGAYVLGLVPIDLILAISNPPHR